MAVSRSRTHYLGHEVRNAKTDNHRRADQTVSSGHSDLVGNKPQEISTMSPGGKMWKFLPERALLKSGKITIDQNKWQAWVNEVPIQLSKGEFNILTALMLANGRVLTKEWLLDNIFDYAKETSTNTIKVQIQTLRKKLGSEASRIKTVFGVGYRFEVEEGSHVVV